MSSEVGIFRLASCVAHRPILTHVISSDAKFRLHFYAALEPCDRIHGLHTLHTTRLAVYSLVWSRKICLYCTYAIDVLRKTCY
jgi:hypothetical protein